MAIRIELFGDEMEAIAVDPLRGQRLRPETVAIYHPASHYVAGQEQHPPKRSSPSKKSCKDCLYELNKENKLLEAQRLEQRTMYDLEIAARPWVSVTVSRTTAVALSGRTRREPDRRRP